MKRYIISLLCLLVALARPALGQDNPQTKAQPPFPVLPYEVLFEEAPEGGTVELLFGSPTSFGITSGTQIRENGELTISVTPADGYRAKLGYPKVFKTGDKDTPVTLTYGSAAYHFKMPAFPVTVEMAFEKIPTDNARLRSLSYVVGPYFDTPVPGFNSDIYEYDIILPAELIDFLAPIAIKAEAESNAATISPGNSQGVLLENGECEASFTVTAEDGTTRLTYTLRFKVAPADSHIVTLGTSEGGTISASYTDPDSDPASGKTLRLKSGTPLPEGTVLTLDNTPVKGYSFDQYNVTGATPDNGRVTVGDNDLTISGSFTKIQSEPVVEIGTPAVPAEEADPTPTVPIVIIPDASALPPGTSLSDLQLVKDEVPADKEDEIKKLIKEQPGAINTENMEIVEITLVQVSKTLAPDGTVTSSSITPVQPSGTVKVRIPYPSGTSSDTHDFALVHLKSDGSVDIYSLAKENLRLTADYIEIDVTSFSPFAISYTAKGTDPDPGIDPDPEPTPDPEPENPTSNATIEDGPKVWASGGRLYVRCERPAEVIVVRASGALADRFMAPAGESGRGLSPGIYFVRLENRLYKMLITD